MNTRMKVVLTTLIGFFVFSMSAFAQESEKKKEESTSASKETSASEQTVMQTPPMMKPAPAMKQQISMDGNFAFSIASFSNKGGMVNEEIPSNHRDYQASHQDFNVNLLQLNMGASVTENSKLNIGFGHGSTVRSLDPSYREGNHRAIDLLNANYNMQVSESFSFMVGRFESPIGHETYNHQENSQFTRTYGFDLAPYFSTGLNLHYGQNMWNVGLLFTNGRGTVMDMSDDNQTMAVTVGLDPMEELKFKLNYLTGNESYDGSFSESGEGGYEYSVSIIDFSAMYEISDMFDIAFNYISQTTTADEYALAGQGDSLANTSMAGYVNFKHSWFTLGLRYERFSFDVLQGQGEDGQALALGGPFYNSTLPGMTGMGDSNSVTSMTLTAKMQMEQNTQFLIEYRMDTGEDENTFMDSDGFGTKSLNTMLAALMYSF